MSDLTPTVEAPSASPKNLSSVKKELLAARLKSGFKKVGQSVRQEMGANSLPTISENDSPCTAILPMSSAQVQNLDGFYYHEIESVVEDIVEKVAEKVDDVVDEVERP